MCHYGTNVHRFRSLPVRADTGRLRAWRGVYGLQRRAHDVSSRGTRDLVVVAHRPDQCIAHPPSTLSVCPVTKAAPSETR